MTRADLIANTKIKIDELVPESELSIVTSGNAFLSSINDTIDSLINESAIEILKIAPLYLVPHTLATGTVTVVDDVGTMPLPDDFLRFGYAKFGVWARTVFNAILAGSKDWMIQQNVWSRGGYKKPVVAINKKPTGYELEFYTIKDTDKGTKEVVYIAAPTTGETITEENDTFPVSMQWLLASKTLEIFGQKDKAKSAYEQFINTLK
jgi:hypothetical protein